MPFVAARTSQGSKCFCIYYWVSYYRLAYRLAPIQIELSLYLSFASVRVTKGVFSRVKPESSRGKARTAKLNVYQPRNSSEHRSPNQTTCRGDHKWLLP